MTAKQWIDGQKKAWVERVRKYERHPDTLHVHKEMFYWLNDFQKSRTHVLGEDLINYCGQLMFRKIPVVSTE